MSGRSSTRLKQQLILSSYTISEICDRGVAQGIHFACKIELSPTRSVEIEAFEDSNIR
jgi:hypothetical protein